MPWQMGKLAELPNRSQQNLASNHYGHPVDHISNYDLLMHSKVAGVADDVIELAERMAGDMEERQKAFLEFRKAFAV